MITGYIKNGEEDQAMDLSRGWRKTGPSNEILRGTQLFPATCKTGIGDISTNAVALCETEFSYHFKLLTCLCKFSCCEESERDPWLCFPEKLKSLICLLQTL